MGTTDLYSSAHIFVAAIRVLQHLNAAAPSIEAVCGFVSFSAEQGNFICRKLTNMDIIDAVDGSYGTRLFVKNHLKIEEIETSDEEDKLAQELKKFQSEQKDKAKKFEALRTEQETKKKNLFSDLEKKLQEELKKKNT